MEQSDLVVPLWRGKDSYDGCGKRKQEPNIGAAVPQKGGTAGSPLEPGDTSVKATALESSVHMAPVGAPASVAAQTVQWAAGPL